MQRICMHCGKEFKAQKGCKIGHVIYSKEDDLTLKRIILCPDCWLELFDRRIKTDDNFYKECVCKE